MVRIEVSSVYPLLSLARPLLALFLLLVLLPEAIHARGPRAEGSVDSTADVQLEVMIARVPCGLGHLLTLPFVTQPRKVEATGKSPKQGFVGVLRSPSDTERLRMLLRRLGEANLVKVVAWPTIATVIGRPASFMCGEREIATPAGRGQVGVQFEMVGIRLNLLPLRGEGGRLSLEVEPEMSEPVTSSAVVGGELEVVGTRAWHYPLTQELERGETLVIGGLAPPAEIGKSAKTELLILITPSPHQP
jgi:Flp pilus assembly secretin CpaC